MWIFHKDKYKPHGNFLYNVLIGDISYVIRVGGEDIETKFSEEGMVMEGHEAADGSVIYQSILLYSKEDTGWKRTPEKGLPSQHNGKKSYAYFSMPILPQLSIFSEDGSLRTGGYLLDPDFTDFLEFKRNELEYMHFSTLGMLFRLYMRSRCNLRDNEYMSKPPQNIIMINAGTEDADGGMMTREKTKKE